jgi:ribosome biogenesis protein SSF1/2
MLLVSVISHRAANSYVLQRIVLLNHDPDTGRLSLRHYTISMAPSGVKKTLKALLARKLGQLPDLGQMADASELLTRSGYGSVSRAWG